MTSNPDEENLRKFLEEVFQGQLPPGALDGMDLGELAQQAGLPSDPAMLRMAALQMQSLFAAGGDGPVNWKIGHDLARQVASGTVTMVPGNALPQAGGTSIGTQGDPQVTPETERALTEAGNVAAMWLASETSFDVVSTSVECWSRGTWVNRTLPRWQKIVEPVAQYMAEAIGDAMAKQLGAAGADNPLAAMGMGDPRDMMKKMGGTMFGLQFGHAIGSIARDALGVTDLSLPLWSLYNPVIVPANVDDLLHDTDLDTNAAHIFLTAREIAHQTLFKSAPWLPEHLFTAVEGYARGITLDLSSLEEKMQDFDVSNPSSLSAISPEEMFTFTRDESQERALTELTTTLALIEGWVDLVVTRSLDGKLPRVDAMRELMRRRRATGGQAEDMLTHLVGIDVRPRLVREAYAWWESVLDTEGMDGRDNVWAHPDLLPSPEVLSGKPQAPQTPTTDDDADGDGLPDLPAFTSMNAASPEFDEELRKLLDGDLPDAPSEADTSGKSDSSTESDGPGESDGSDASDSSGKSDGSGESDDSDDPDDPGDLSGPTPDGQR